MLSSAFVSKGKLTFSSSFLLLPQIGSIKLDKFVARTQPDVAAAVLRLTADGAEEFVLDLRNNLGGLVEEGVEVARLFLDGKLKFHDCSHSADLKTCIFPMVTYVFHQCLLACLFPWKGQIYFDY